MEPRRFSGKTVEEATDNALETLDANLEDVEIVVVNPGRSGILGFGGEPAEIDVVLLDAGASGRSFDSSSEPDDDDDAPDSDDDYEHYEPESLESDDGYEGELEDEPGRSVVSAPMADVKDEDSEPEEGQPQPPSTTRRGGGQRHRPESAGRSERPERRERPSEPDPEVIEFASEVIDYFLASMSVVADTYIREETDDGVPVFDIEGEDSGLLIGRRGETLQSLQYLVNLIVTHQLGRSAYVQIDVEGYKQRRRETLAGVAQRTAERVVDTGESAELEPMSAYERRWVHMALANNSEVTTESSGEGSDRFVVIYPGGGGNGGGNSGGARRSRGRRGRGGGRGRG
ncbi:MAG TPA: RNA-binding cell elongation regulator Jag/EloR [Dehalococcoidia bacterium]|jgi:spoIIIJ-associated protein|nr:RNA-binding cell elongation regulator Jag/EloR [Dehalococcoidia bacterium]MDP6274263.1 RNA-binding cell elongation regulator Jag/EloR [Dehalococcoidia bacterium]MDP7160927.1 RNA-binding cell elongation regulator Jag/EloR [Dehalococcoidia bacterium]MDP7212959.1 RNA-binding cell elongation regulator Jag/EloR [Dehalococcoidia bacterium]MDP7514757.1 RNA-binding cell elongation regulator Jag/EloR [Dehalococcoidia bacterium]|tara:strand:+ start:2684 stop:3715 length:1032 start_codon:yes stop_codon:yes gene_type:complete